MGLYTDLKDLTHPVLNTFKIFARQFQVKCTSLNRTGHEVHAFSRQGD